LRVSLARVASVLSLLALVGCGSHSREARKPDTTRLAPPSNSDLRALMKVFPIGTPVVISA
jgi:hypothetical protein